MKYDPFREALEIREQLASEKRKLAFFFGGGTSMSAGLPGIKELTMEVAKELKDNFKGQFGKIKKELPGDANVEDVLDRIRIYRELIAESTTAEFAGIKGKEAAKKLDATICQLIAKSVSVPTFDRMKAHRIFAQWLRILYCNRNWPVEIFTTNYDVLFESSMEEIGVPFFDGFVGSVEPFFVPESIEADEEDKNCASSYPPRMWTRLWKIHGSINWHIVKQKFYDSERISRFTGVTDKEGGELMIFPSREKYAQSRKLPFIALQDRLRKFVLTGESLVIIVGYSFSDQHINDILLQGLRTNPRMTIMVFLFETPNDNILSFGKENRNLILYGPDKACIGGIVSDWVIPTRQKKDDESWPFWDEKTNKFVLGNFTKFAAFLEEYIGFRQYTSQEKIIQTGSATEMLKQGQKEEKLEK